MSAAARHLHDVPDRLAAQLRARAEELRKELGRAEKILQSLEQQRQETMQVGLRIAGALQVIEEELARV